jgi:hypothetical protein
MMAIARVICCPAVRPISDITGMMRLRSEGPTIWRGVTFQAPPCPSVSRVVAKNSKKSTYDVRTRTERLHIRTSRDEIAALDYLAEKWDASRSDVVRSVIVGAALARLDRLDDARDAVEPNFDDVLPFRAWR